MAVREACSGKAQVASGSDRSMISARRHRGRAICVAPPGTSVRPVCGRRRRRGAPDRGGCMSSDSGRTDGAKRACLLLRDREFRGPETAPWTTISPGRTAGESGRCSEAQPQSQLEHALIDAFAAVAGGCRDHRVPTQVVDGPVGVQYHVAHIGSGIGKVRSIGGV